MRTPWSFLMTVLRGGSAPRRDDNRERLASLPQHYSQFDMALSWEIRQAGRETTVEGVLKNLRYAHMDGIEIWVAVVDAAGKAGARSACFIPHQIRQDEIAPFSVKLPLLVETGTLLRFTYKYQGADGGEGGLNWPQSFDGVVP